MMPAWRLPPAIFERGNSVSSTDGNVVGVASLRVLGRVVVVTNGMTPPEIMSVSWLFIRSLWVKSGYLSYQGKDAVD